MVFHPHTGALIYNAPMCRTPLAPLSIGCTRTLPGALIAVLISTLLVALMLPTALRADTPLRVAVAANFRVAAERLGTTFTEKTGTQVLISSASTGVLAAQLRGGAPFDLLLAADRKRPDALAAGGFTLGPARCYTEGTLVLLGASSLEAALANSQLSIAIANPRSAPYGIAARAVLARAGFAGPDQRRVVMGSNVRQAFQFFQSGAADLAMVARSLSPQAGIPIPPEWHPPITQYAIIGKNSPQAQRSEDFLAYIASEPAQDFLVSLGYGACP
ncbi:MAG: molybdate transport system substrate-binding protein [Halieaceae bacterium]